MSTELDGAAQAARQSELRRRIAATPPDAEIRAIFLHVADEAFAREAKGRVAPARKRPRGYSMIPVRSFLEEIQHLGELLGPTPEAGISRLFANTASFLVNHPGARLFITARDRDPLVLLERLERTRSMMSSYGEWRVTGRRGDVLVTVRNEWAWLDTMWCSIIRSVFPACGGAAAEIDLTLETPFSGTVRVRW